jgi:hypothetical protein
MDARLIPVLLGSGWLLLTLGIWGSTGRYWWIWPLFVGIGLLVAGAGYLWAAVVQLRRGRAAMKPQKYPAEVSK